jgi:hypothetical protein
MGRWSSLLLLALVAGCVSPTPPPRDRRPSDRPDGGTSWSPEDPPPSCAASIRGVVRFPNGIQPVPGAQVYVPASGEAATRTGTCGQCIESASVYAYAETGVDGSFTLAGVPEGSWRVVIEKGKFSRTAEVTVGCGDHLTLDDETTRLPRNRSEGSIPSIAIGTGAFDFMQDVVAKMGLDEVDLYDGDGLGGGPSLEMLLHDRARLTAYDVVFLNCGSLPEEGDPWGGGTSIVDDTAVLENLRALVEGGGRLYVTDEAYDYVERAFPRYVEYAIPGGDGLSERAEPEDAAEIGDDLSTVRGQVHDADLAAWLSQVGAMDGDRVPIQGMIGGWAVIRRVDETRAKVWVSGAASWGAGAPDSGRGTVPLTVTYDRGCGRVLYTSYHTVGEGASRAMAPQELILAYLTLEIGTCIEDPVLF